MFLILILIGQMYGGSSYERPTYKPGQRQYNMQQANMHRLVERRALHRLRKLDYIIWKYDQIQMRKRLQLPQP